MTTLAAETFATKPARFSQALVRLSARSQRTLWGLRLGRLYGIGVGVTYAVMAAVAPASLASAANLWARCLATASWVAGVGALSLATELGERDATQGLTSLAQLRGFGAAQLERARMLAGALRLGTTVLLPGLMLSAALLLRYRSLRGSLVALTLGVLTVPYAALVGGSLAPLARACSRWLPGRGRLLLLALVLGPWLLGSGLGAPVPSIPSAFGWLLSHVARSFR